MTAGDDRGGRSDWTDQDLLLKGDAARRLDGEIAALSGELAGLPEGPDAEAARKRLDLLGRARARIAGERAGNGVGPVGAEAATGAADHAEIDPEEPR